MELSIIAHARNGFSEKFGIPRQTVSDTCLTTRIVFVPEYRVSDALRGIEQFSHLWVIWGFHDLKRSGSSWTATVRPPRLGGNTRMGVFATRSPYRPNPIGLSSVRLLRVEQTPQEGAVLVVSGADMMDGTPIYDIKPYLAYSDSHPDAVDGFATGGLSKRLEVLWECKIPDDELLNQLNEISSLNPVPAYKHDKERIYGMDYGGASLKFRIDEKGVHVIKCTFAV
jgi:tRNA-Thr(GGU) m(6)t(6)A37 methyltransferase TsaA